MEIGFSILNISVLWSSKFLMRNLLRILLSIPMCWWVASHLLLSIFSFCLWILTVWLQYFGVGLFHFILLGVCWTFSIFIFVFHQIWDIFNYNFFQIMFLSFFLPYLLLGLPWFIVCPCNGVSHVPYALFAFLRSLFFLFLQPDHFKFADFMFCLFKSLCWISSFQLYFSAQNVKKCLSFCLYIHFLNFYNIFL